MKIAVLGAGMVGTTIAIDLAKDHEVTSFDVREVDLTVHNIQCIATDLTLYDNYPELLSRFDIVVSAVPGFMGYKVLEAIIRSGKHVVDISFFPEDALLLDGLAKHHGVTAIVDCGVAPGLSNLIAGYWNHLMKVDSFLCMVGGLPKIRTKPFEYKAPFSPIDVIEEYTRPARYLENGFQVTKPALSDAELINFDEVGTLECFNTDGLRSLMYTLPDIKDMKERTLRYPGHIDLMKALIAAGFLDHNPIIFKGQEIRPIDFNAAILFKQWKLKPEEEDFTFMKIIIKGNGRKVETTLYDSYDRITKTSSMSRTTGYTCNAFVNCFLSGIIRQAGVFPPELLAPIEGCYGYIEQYLTKRGVVCTTDTVHIT